MSKNEHFKSNVPFEIAEGIRDSIGRKNVVTLKKMVKLERSSGDKSDSKVLVLTPYRCQILGVKSPFKMEVDFHFLDIKLMDSSSPERVFVRVAMSGLQKLQLVTHNGKKYQLQMIGSDDADHIIGRVTLSLRTIFPNVALSRIVKASLEPLHRQKVIQTMLNQADQVEAGPCGNFSEMYQCVCDYLGCPAREEVQWCEMNVQILLCRLGHNQRKDVDMIYLSQNCRLINLKDLDLQETKDIIPVVSVMVYNQWFEGLVVRDRKLSTEILESILKVSRSSHNLKHLLLEGIGVKGDFATKLSSNLVKNKESCIESLDLSNNPLEDKGVLHLSGSLPVMKHGSIKRLNLSRTGLTAKGISGLCQSLRSSETIMTSLTHLNLSGNSIRSDEAEGLYNFLSTENHITHLDLSSTDCAVEIYISAMAKGCKKHLTHVSVAKNHFYSKDEMGSRHPHYLEDDRSRKNKDNSLPSSFQEFFRDTSALKIMDFSSMKFPPEALRCVMDGLLSNTTRGLEVSLNLSSCELKSAGCQVLQSTIGSVKNLVSLDVSDNSFDNDVISLLMWIQHNKSLRELLIGKNFFGIKPKYMKEVMEAIVELVQEENSVLQSLSLCDSKIKDCMNTFLGCLGSNTSLTSLDISGNWVTDNGSRALAKSLQINSKLKILKFDRNNFTAAGFSEIATSMENNYSLRHIPYPINDAVAAMKHQPERTQLELARMQDLLLRNANVNKTSNDQQFRLQSVVSTTAQQVLDKVAEKVDDIVNALEILEADSACSDVVINAKNLVKDAKNSKSLLTNIYGLGMERSVGESSQLQTKLNKMASDIDTMVNQHIKETIDAMKQSTEAQCPHIYKETKDELAVMVEERCHLPRDHIKEHVIKTSGIGIGNKVSEVNLGVSTAISHNITDGLLAVLTKCNSALTEELTNHKQHKQSDQSLAASAVTESPPKVDEISDEKPTSVTVKVTVDRPPEGDLLPIMRKERAASVAKRRQRPMSSSPSDGEVTQPKSQRVESFPATEEIPEEEEEESRISVDEEVTVEEENKVEVDGMEVTAEPSEVVDEVAELPEVTEQKALEHITKNRPKGPTKRTRRPASKAVTADEYKVDTFFTNNVSNTDFTSTLTIEEEAIIKEKEKDEEKKASKKVVGKPLITPGMLKVKKKDEDEDAHEEEEIQRDEAKEERSSMRRPKGAMVMHGMGFGGNLLAEMKLKKLGKKSDSEDGKRASPNEASKTEGSSPFGPSILKKTPESSSKRKNQNENNNNSARTFLSRNKSDSEKKEGEKSKTKGKPMTPPSKPLVEKGKPPPLPTKPKPALLKSGRQAKSSRPMSEYIEPNRVPPVARSRTGSLGKKTDQSGAGGS